MSGDKSININGAQVAAEILSRLPSATAERLVESIRSVNPRSATQIETIIIRQMASAPKRENDETTIALEQQGESEINTITQVPGPQLQEVVREVPSRELAISLKNVPDDMREKVLTNLSASKRAEVLDELNSLPPMKLHDVESAQARLLKNVDELYKDTLSTDGRRRRLKTRRA